MKFEIEIKGIKDKSLNNLINQTLSYYLTINKEKSKLIQKSSNNKQLIADFMQNLVTYLEVGLKNKCSVNLSVIISDQPNYAIKYEKGFLATYKFYNYEILVFKTPYITIPSKYFKTNNINCDNKINLINESIIYQKAFISSNNYNTLDYFCKIKDNKIKSISKLNEKSLVNKNINIQDKSELNIIEHIKDNLQALNNIKNNAIDKSVFINIIFNNIIYCIKNIKDDKNFLSELSQAIQYDLSDTTKDYNFNVVIANKIILSKTFISTSNIFYHCKINDNQTVYSEDDTELSSEDKTNSYNSIDQTHFKSKSLKLPKLKNKEILIYHKTCVFESVFKNIISGRFQNVEFKHIFILFSCIVFFIFVFFCDNSPNAYLDRNSKDASWFEDKVCRNKGNYLSGIGVLFMIIIVSGVLKKRINNNNTTSKSKLK